MTSRLGRSLSAALIASLSLLPAMSMAADPSAWNVVEATDGTTCGATTDGAVLIATPDGSRYGIIVANVTLGDHPQRDIRIDGTPVPFAWAQLRTTAFTPLDEAQLAKIAAARTVELEWPERKIVLQTDGISAALTKLKACGEAIRARRLATANPAPPAAPGPLKLHLVCQGVRVTTEEEETSVSISNDRDVTRSASGSATTERVVRIPGRVDVSVEGAAVRLNPSAILRRNLLFKTPKGGWYDLTDVKIDADEIAGKFSLTVFQKPQMTIDRHTGAIRLAGLGMQYTGTCEKSAQPIDAQKF